MLFAEVYNPKAVILHAASLRQAFAHCARFPIAASRRSRARVSVPFCLFVLSDQVPVKALVGHYPTNKLIGRRLIPNRCQEGNCKQFPYLALTQDLSKLKSESVKSLVLPPHQVLLHLSVGYPRVKGRFLRVTQPFAMLCSLQAEN